MRRFFFQAADSLALLQILVCYDPFLKPVERSGNCISIADSIMHVFILSRLSFTLRGFRPASCSLSVGKDILGTIPCLFSMSRHKVLHIMNPTCRISQLLMQ